MEQRLSRSKIELFVECPRCFYFDRRLGVARPSGPPFNLNLAVDHLLKKEFDFYRAQHTPHPLMEKHGIEAIPFSHPELDTWRENFKGIQHHHSDTHFLITGAVDDIWINTKDELIVVDYKATSRAGKISSTFPIYPSYQRQMEVYQWLLRENGFEVASQGYFVYCNGIKERPRFDNCLEFDITILRCEGNLDWIEPTLFDIYSTLEQAKIPEAGKDCPYCKFATGRAQY